LRSVRRRACLRCRAGQFLAPAGRYFPDLLEEPVAEADLASRALAQAGGAAWVKVIADFPALPASAGTVVAAQHHARRPG
jgi:hypothetical protein